MGNRSNDPFAFDALQANTINTPQTFQQKATKQLHEINEILSKSRTTFPQLGNLPADHYKVFPDERPPPAPVKEEFDPTKMKTPKVTLSRLKLEDEVLMQKSLTEFAKKSPELARKLGVVKDEPDMFSKMKADGKFSLINILSVLMRA